MKRKPLSQTPKFSKAIDMVRKWPDSTPKALASLVGCKTGTIYKALRYVKRNKRKVKDVEDAPALEPVVEPVVGLIAVECSCGVSYNLLNNGWSKVICVSCGAEIDNPSYIKTEPMVYVRGDSTLAELCVVEDGDCKAYPLSTTKVTSLLKQLAECL